jgi:carbamoyl-phosphate synthase small subunit
MSRAILILEDGTPIEAPLFGPRKDIFGEIVFNTSMTGYTEAFTDPSYAGQILLMTYPLIGNYGVYTHDFESARVQIRALVLKEPCFNSHRGMSLQRFLTRYNIPCLYNVDTRRLTLHIRDHGTMKAMIVGKNTKAESLSTTAARVRTTPHPDSQNLVKKVSCRTIIRHRTRHKSKIVLIDCGVKASIIRSLKRYATVIQVPYNTSAQAIKKLKPNGVVISNGPGNPAHPDILSTTVATLQALLGEYPMFGVCLGHQILGLALGHRTFKLKFGHRGSNHAAKHIPSGRVYITSQNHGYALDMREQNNTIVEWINVNDGTVEGFRHTSLPVWSVQFHPEAAPGPNDTSFLFGDFMRSIHAKTH